jgi:hypothetical protein
VGPFDGKESELNWQGRDRAITRVRGMLKGDVHIRFEQAFLVCVQGKFLSDSYKAVRTLHRSPLPFLRLIHLAPESSNNFSSEHMLALLGAGNRH